MKVVLTGAAGFLASRMADLLLGPDSPLHVTELVLSDSQLPAQRDDPRVRLLAVDLSKPGAADQLIDGNTDVLFHMAAVVSGHAEADFDYGFKVNLDATRELLELARKQAPSMKFVFTSTLAVFGGDLPPVVDDNIAVMPQNSYGTAKAISELLINDYSRKGFVDGRIVRLPTVSIRAGAPNRAVTSFASGIIREPLNGVLSICPVPPEQEIWLTSPRTVVRNIVHAATVPVGALGFWRCVTLPGICVSVNDMVEALREVAGEETAALVHFEIDETISRMVATFPTKFDISRALRLGFKVDNTFVEFIRAYIHDDIYK